MKPTLLLAEDGANAVAHCQLSNVRRRTCAKSDKAKTYVYPSEDSKLLACQKVPLILRVLFGFLAREGPRTSEALDLTWSDLNLDHGVVYLDENKTDDPRSWSLDTGVAEALRRWKKNFAPTSAPTTRVFPNREGGRLDAYGLARRLRASLKKSGVARPQLFENSDRRIPIRAHDLRATFVTVSLANGKTEAWVTDRTGHQSSEMLYEYKRQARTHAELNLGPLAPLHEAILELAAVKARKS